MNEKGLQCRSYENRLSIAGNVSKNIVSPIKYFGGKREIWYQFYFEPQDVEEEKLKSFIERHITA